MILHAVTRKFKIYAIREKIENFVFVSLATPEPPPPPSHPDSWGKQGLKRGGANTLHVCFHGNASQTRRIELGFVTKGLFSFICNVTPLSLSKIQISLCLLVLCNVGNANFLLRKQIKMMPAYLASLTGKQASRCVLQPFVSQCLYLRSEIRRAY